MATSGKSSRNRGPKAVKVDPERILDAVQTVFARDGIKGSSIRAISREAGCDPALIYYHFENKEAMFSALLDRKFLELHRDLFRLADASDERHTAERLWDVLRVYRRLLLDDAGFRALVRGEIIVGTEGTRDAIAQRVLPMLRALSGLLLQGIERGHVRADLQPVLGTFFLVRPYIELLDVVPVMSSRILGVPADEALRMSETVWFEIYWRGITAQPELPPFLKALKESRS